MSINDYNSLAQTAAVQGQWQGGQSVSLNDAVPSVTTEFETHLKRLSEIASATEQLGVAIHGPEPKAAGTAPATPRPMPSMASRVRDLGDLLSTIEANLRRIGNRL